MLVVAVGENSENSFFFPSFLLLSFFFLLLAFFLLGAMCAVHKCHLKASGDVFAVKVFHLKGKEHHAVLQQLAAEISTHRLIRYDT